MRTIRTLSEEDYPHVARIFFDAVHVGTQNVYSLPQRLAWAGETPNPERFKDRLSLNTHASLAAKPFFEKQGWEVMGEEDVFIGEIALHRFRMQKAAHLP